MSIAAYNKRIEENYKWNFFWMTLDNMMFFFIFMGLSPYTILPFYVGHFTESMVLIGLIPTLFLIGTTLPQIFMANFLRNRRERKKYLVISASLQRLAILGLFLLSVLQPKYNLSANLTLTVFFIMHALQHTASGFYIPAWIDFLGKSIPRKRGLLFGISNFIGGLMGLGMGWLLSYLLTRYPFGHAIPVIFGISLAASMVSLIAILFWREVVPPEEFFEGKEKGENTFRTTLRDTNFVKYLLWRGLMVILEIATPFYTISALEQLALHASQVGVFTTILSFSEAVLNPLWGWIGDRKGFIRVVQISAFAGSAGALLVAAMPSLWIYYITFFLAGAMISGLQISSLNIVYEFSPKQLVPLYTAVSQIALTPLSSIVPTLGGVIVEKLGYSTNYWLAGILGLFSLAGMSIQVTNPKKHKKSDMAPKLEKA
jgi:MFS family permease